MLVEDNVLVQQSLLHALELIGFPARPAADGEQALAMLTETPYRFVLMDVQMPGISGIEALVKIRQLEGPNGDVPVAIMSGNDSEVVAAKAAGADGFVIKPISVAELGKAVQQLVTRPRQSHAK
ncbi:Signal transduction response regulator, receiver region domain protein [Rhodopirellula maiorica SM1]|uniref:Signal transduction response regulator, receiver region domain protein n=1 Tax=Rhodopirellula maiorica SM1 TaxID=1265738 RepID=M5RBR1_9BACT|nr:Signal transduction response regulator, receiver region domain protein [Rhodopirellula maiorica SM1]